MAAMFRHHFIDCLEIEAVMGTEILVLRPDHRAPQNGIDVVGPAVMRPFAFDQAQQHFRRAGHGQETENQQHHDGGRDQQDEQDP